MTAVTVLIDAAVVVQHNQYDCWCLEGEAAAEVVVFVLRRSQVMVAAVAEGNWVLLVVAEVCGFRQKAGLQECGEVDDR